MIQNHKYLTSSNPKRAIFEKREIEQRRRQETRLEILKGLAQDSLLMNAIDSDKRVERKRVVKEKVKHVKEKEVLDLYYKETQRRKEILEETRREEEVVNMMNTEFMQQLRDQKKRQAIREGSSELRELEQKLNYAYMNKERMLQIQEKELLKQLEESKSNLMYGDWKRVAESVREEEEEMERRNQEKVFDYQQELQKQLKEQEEKKRQEYEQFLKEKAIVDDIVFKIQTENLKEAEEKKRKALEAKGFVEEYVRDRHEWLEREKEKQKEENRSIEEFAQLQHTRQVKLKQEKATMEAGKNAIYDKLSADMQKNEKLKSELEDLRIDLAQEEQEAQARKKDQDELRNRIRKRLETIEAYHKQIHDKKQRLDEIKKEEDEFREKMMKKFAEDDRIEQMKQQNRRMKQLEHRRAVDKIIQDRRVMRQEKEAEEKLQNDYEKELSRYKNEVIEQERQRLLREHASKLAGFLPKGVLRDQKDLDLFDEEFRKRFERQQ